jgi:hypothetical protein
MAGAGCFLNIVQVQLGLEGTQDVNRTIVLQRAWLEKPNE